MLANITHLAVKNFGILRQSSSILGKLRQSACFLPFDAIVRHRLPKNDGVEGGARRVSRNRRFGGAESAKNAGVLEPQSCLHRKVRFSVRPGKPFLRPRLLPISHRESGGQGWPQGHRASGAERGLEGREPDGMLLRRGLLPDNTRKTATLASLAPLSGYKPRQNKDLSWQSSGTAGSRQRPCDRDARQKGGTLGPVRDAPIFCQRPCVSLSFASQKAQTGSLGTLSSLL